MSLWLQQQWYKLGVWHLLLIPVSWLFVLLAASRRLAYRLGLLRAFKLPVPVIVVGNISVGGSGKTPLVIWLAQQLQAAGWQPGIISRGYAGQAGQAMAVHAGSDPGQVGDEPVLIARRLDCPLWIGRDRVAAAQALLQAHPGCNVIISDDGLQHCRLQRDLEIAVVDADRLHGNGWRLPAGPLRESPARLAQVDLIIHNGGNAPVAGAVPAFGMQLHYTDFVALGDGSRRAGAASFQGQAVHAIAGIGNPQRFFRTLQQLGVQFQAHAYADHHAYTLQELQALNAQVLLMTEKDAVKCMAFAQAHWWYLPVDAIIAHAAFRHIEHKLQAICTGNKPINPS